MSINRFVKAFIALSLLSTVSLAARAEAVIDQFAPVFSATAADGSTVKLTELRGKNVILEWTNHQCPFVRKHYESGNIPNLQKQAAAQGVVWLQVISSAPGKEGYADGPAAQKLNRERDASPANTLLDPTGAIGKLYGATNTPQLFLIDAQGKLRFKGGIDSIASTDKADIAKAENYISAALTEMAAGKPISKTVAKPYGCSIKYLD